MSPHSGGSPGQRGAVVIPDRARPPQECKRSNVNWISPEHILLAMLAMPDCNGKRVLGQ